MIRASTSRSMSSNSVETAEAISKSDAIKPLVEDFDRQWQGRVTRRRAVLDVVQEIEP